MEPVNPVIIVLVAGLVAVVVVLLWRRPKPEPMPWVEIKRDSDAMRQDIDRIKGQLTETASRSELIRALDRVNELEKGVIGMTEKVKGFEPVLENIQEMVGMLIKHQLDKEKN